MSTRGAVGFIVDGVEKISYNHSDSYPDYLGRNILEFCFVLPHDIAKKIVKKIKLVGDIPPTAKQIKECKKFTNLNVSEKSTKDWYCLLREAQGNLWVYIDGLKYMINYKGFLKESLFCEYAYIVNLDTGKLEFYTGFNKNSNAGRYANVKADEYGYVGVAFCSEYDLSSITKDSIDDIIKDMNKRS